ncbi:MAG: alpha/beta hydrolase family protein [Blastocatellia bacterium]
MKPLPYSLVVLFLMFLAQPPRAQGTKTMSFGEIAKLPKPAADHRIPYGSDPLQFGDLRLPAGKGPHPVVIVVHGGCWFAEYDLNHLAAFCDALTKAGVATWSLEYRRIGDKGGAWPGTFHDVARGADYLRDLAKTYPLELKRVVVIGHSAGGHLALWLAARKKLAKDSELYQPDPLPLSGVVSLAGISDLRKYSPRCDDAVNKLMGGGPDQYAARYRQVSPLEMLPLKVPLRLIHGARDSIVPLDMARAFETEAKAKGDQASLTVLDNAGHFELISPLAAEWAVVRGAVLDLLKPADSRR